MARGAGLTVEVDASAPALLPGVEDLLRSGVRTGASARNWASYGDDVREDSRLADWRRDLLTDPQTSGGLLIAVAPDAAPAVLQLAIARGFGASRIVGRAVAGPASLSLTGGEC
jgi:selenide,water dikinase